MTHSKKSKSKKASSIKKSPRRKKPSKSDKGLPYKVMASVVYSVTAVLVFVIIAGVYYLHLEKNKNGQANSNNIVSEEYILNPEELNQISEDMNVNIDNQNNQEDEFYSVLSDDSNINKSSSSSIISSSKASVSSYSSVSSQSSTVSVNASSGTYTRTPIRLAIVIDDVGYRSDCYDDFIALNIPITYAVIPETPFAEYYFNILKNSGFDMILHIPMEPIRGREFVESNAILSDMSESEIRESVTNMIEMFDGIKGANNHMGSKVTGDARVMNIVLNEMSNKGLYWLDSKTINTQVPYNAARLNNTTYYSRDAFLDNEKTLSSIRSAMSRFIQSSRSKGYGVAIGHIQTPNLPIILKEFYNKRYELNIRFVSLDKIN